MDALEVRSPACLAPDSRLPFGLHAPIAVSALWLGPPMINSLPARLHANTACLRGKSRARANHNFRPGVFFAERAPQQRASIPPPGLATACRAGPRGLCRDGSGRPSNSARLCPLHVVPNPREASSRALHALNSADGRHARVYRQPPSRRCSASRPRPMRRAPLRDSLRHFDTRPAPRLAPPWNPIRALHLKLTADKPPFAAGPRLRTPSAQLMTP